MNPISSKHRQKEYDSLVSFLNNDCYIIDCCNYDYIWMPYGRSKESEATLSSWSSLSKNYGKPFIVRSSTRSQVTTAGMSAGIITSVGGNPSVVKSSPTDNSMSWSGKNKDIPPYEYSFNSESGITGEYQTDKPVYDTTGGDLIVAPNKLSISWLKNKISDSNSGGWNDFIQRTSKELEWMGDSGQLKGIDNSFWKDSWGRLLSERLNQLFDRPEFENTLWYSFKTLNYIRKETDNKLPTCVTEYLVFPTTKIDRSGSYRRADFISYVEIRYFDSMNNESPTLHRTSGPAFALIPNVLRRETGGKYEYEFLTPDLGVVKWYIKGKEIPVINIKEWARRHRTFVDMGPCIGKSAFVGTKEEMDFYTTFS